MRQRPLNKSNKIDVIHFLKLNDNLGNFTPTNGMGKRHNSRVRVTHARTYGIVKNDNFLKCAINLLNCSCHPHDDGCFHSVGHARLVTSYNLESQITKSLTPPPSQPPRSNTGLWRLFWAALVSRRGRVDGGLWPAYPSFPPLGMERGRGGGKNETVARQWCTALQAHKAGHQLTSEARGNREGLYDHHQI